MNTIKNENVEVAVIGGGAIGIIAGKWLKHYSIPYLLYEAENDLGGTWYFGSGAGRVYETTHVISSKTNTEFSDHPMPADYPAYPNHAQILQYLRDVATEFGVYSHARFEHTLAQLEPLGDKWKLRFNNGVETVASAVIVGTGRLRKPIIPNYPGSFDGTIFHSSEYRSPEQLRGKRVLVVGGGNSGCDIANDAALYSAYACHSTRRGYHYMPKFIEGQPTQDWMMSMVTQLDSEQEVWRHAERVFHLAGFDGTAFGLPAPDHPIEASHPIINSQILFQIGHGKLTPKPDIASFEGKQVIFTDGSKDIFDLVILGTGYQSIFPFLNPLVFSGRIEDLYMGMFHRSYENLIFGGFIGAPTGLGNLANTTGQFLATYLQERALSSEKFRIFRRVVAGPEPSLGRERFVKNERHRNEVDLYAFLEVAQFLTSQLKTKDIETEVKKLNDENVNAWTIEIRHFLAKVSGLEEVSEDINLNSLGLDSLMISELFNFLTTGLSVNITPTLFFECNTPIELGQAFASRVKTPPPQRSKTSKTDQFSYRLQSFRRRLKPTHQPKQVLKESPSIAEIWTRGTHFSLSLEAAFKYGFQPTEYSTPYGLLPAWSRLGVGTPLVFIGGLGTTAALWSSLLEKIGRNHRAVLIDLPNKDWSDAWMNVSFSELAKSLALLLEKELDSPAILFAFSFGGRIAVTLAEHLVNRIEAIFTVSTPLHIEDITEYPGAALATELKKLEQSGHPVSFAIPYLISNATWINTAPSYDFTVNYQSLLDTLLIGADDLYLLKEARQDLYSHNEKLLVVPHGGHFLSLTHPHILWNVLEQRINRPLVKLAVANS